MAWYSFDSGALASSQGDWILGNVDGECRRSIGMRMKLVLIRNMGTLIQYQGNIYRYARDNDVA